LEKEMKRRGEVGLEKEALVERTRGHSREERLEEKRIGLGLDHGEEVKRWS
jgi:hypothetical protein